MKALYHQTGREPLSLDVLKQHDDGTVDLGRGDQIVVSRCPVVAAPQPGHATLGPDPKAAAEAKAKADAEAKAKAEADAKSKEGGKK